MHTFTLGDFDFALPDELIAQHPATERSASRLLDGTGEQPVDRTFRDLPALLSPGDLLVFNDTKVVKARLYGEKPTGGKVELLIERVLQGNEVVAHVKVSKKPPWARRCKWPAALPPRCWAAGPMRTARCFATCSATTHIC